MKKVLLLTIVMIAVALMVGGIAVQAADVPVAAADLFGSRSTPDGSGVHGAGLYSDFMISWKISELGGGLWSYTYTLSKTDGTALAKNVSHVLFQVTNPSAAVDFTMTDAVLVDGPQLYQPNSDNNENPGLPGDIYAIKLDTVPQDENPAVMAFTTWHSPIWGDFYVKDGNAANFAYNSGFGSVPEASFANWIPRPDGPSSIPEPVFFQFGALMGLGGLGVFRLRRRA